MYDNYRSDLGMFTVFEVTGGLGLVVELGGGVGGEETSVDLGLGAEVAAGPSLVTDPP